MTRARDIADQQDNSGGAVAPFVAGKNVVINGGMDIWQRGTSFASQSTNDVYTADRWKTAFTGTSLNVTISRSTDVPNVSFPYSLKFQQLSNSATSVTNFGTAQGIETPNATVLFGKAVTISFWYKSNLTGSHYIRIYTGGQTGGVDNATAFTVNVADTWEYKTITTTNFSTITAVANTTLGAQIDIGRRVYQGGTSTTINTNDYFQLVGVQIEAGSTATAFQTATGTIQGELAACRRYYYQPTGTRYVGVGVANNTTEVIFAIPLPSTMRTNPSVSVSSFSHFEFTPFATFSAVNVIDGDGSICSFYT